MVWRPRCTPLPPDDHMTERAPDRYAVLGHPVAHSQSPFIHAEFAKATGQHMVYERVLSPLDAFTDTVRRFAAEGGRGCNITLPFKFEAMDLAERCSGRAVRAGAANVLRFDEEGWWADNTDGVGLVRDIEGNAQHPLAGQRVLLVGAGGAAAGALGSLISARPALVVLANRTESKALELAQSHGPWAEQHGVVLQATGLAAPGEAFDVVINSSASSVQGAGVPVPASVLRPGTLALDMMYGPAAAGFMAWAQQHGATPRDGLGMLVEQAAEAFMVFRGVLPATADVLRALRQRMGSPQ